MSRFHFDENVMENAAASLKAVNQELGGCLVELMLIKTVVQKEKGYNINEICNKLGNENDKLKYCCERTVEGAEEINQIKSIVAQYDNKTIYVRSEVVQYVEAHSINNRYQDPFFKYTTANSDIVEKYISSNIWNFVRSQTYDAFWATLTRGGYEQSIVYESLRSVIDSLNPDNSIQNQLAGILNKYDLNEIESNVNLAKEKVDELINVDGLSDLVKYLKEAKFDIKIIAILASDYSINLEYLASLERTLQSTGMDTEVLNKVMSAMRNDYQNKYLDAVKQMSVQAIKSLSEEALKAYVPGGELVMSIKKYSDIYMNINDGGKTMDSQKTFVAMQTYSANVSASLEKLGNKIASGDYTQQELADFKNMFELAKSMRVKMYESALEFTAGEEKATCEEALNYYKNLTM